MRNCAEPWALPSAVRDASEIAAIWPVEHGVVLVLGALVVVLDDGGIRLFVRDNHRNRWARR